MTNTFLHHHMIISKYNLGLVISILYDDSKQLKLFVGGSFYEDKNGVAVSMY